MDHFEVTYQLRLLSGETVEQKIEDLCLEQSAELPRRLLSRAIAERVTGKPGEPQKISDNHWRVSIQWPTDDIGDEITQLLNLLYGNISMKPGIRILDLSWDSLPSGLMNGPAWGIDRLREAFGTPRRALSSTALKPMGADAGTLGNDCYEFACGGIDVIKDDHGLANQHWAPFEERLKAGVEAVRRAADDAGHRARYFPNITSSASKTLERYRLAAETGADGALICPHLCGPETLHQLARTALPLPLIAHPAFSGALTGHPDSGFEPGFLCGGLWRALGADFVIYPNTGGRFNFSSDDCHSINAHARATEQPWPRSFPMPGGGIKFDTLPGWIEEYGRDITFLIGGGLYDHPKGIRYAAREFTELLQDQR